MADAIEIVINGTDKGFLKTLEKAAAAEEKMASGLGKVKQAADGVGTSMSGIGKTAEKSFGADAINQLTTFAGSFLSLSAAIDLVTRSLEMMRREQEKAMSAFDQLEKQRKEMSQVAKGKEDYDAMIKEAERVSTTYGLSQVDSHKLINAARAGEFEPDIDKVALAAATHAEVDDLTGVAAELPDAFGDKISAFNAIAVTDAIGADARALDFAKSSKHMRSVAGSMSILGGTPTEAAAMVATLSSDLGGSTGDLIRDFAGSMALKPGFKGLGAFGTLDKLQGMTEDQRKEVMGEAQGLWRTYNAMDSKEGRMRELEAKYQKVMTGEIDPVAAGSEAYLANNENAAAYARNISEQKKEVQSQKELLVPALNNEAAKADVRRIQSERGASWINRAGTEAAMWAGDFLGWGPEEIRYQAGYLDKPRSEGAPPAPSPRNSTANTSQKTQAQTQTEALTNAAKHLEKATAAMSNTVQQSRQNAANQEALGARE